MYSGTDASEQIVDLLKADNDILQAVSRTGSVSDWI